MLSNWELVLLCVYLKPKCSTFVNRPTFQEEAENIIVIYKQVTVLLL